jgi:cytochrome b involved in lipid metabolism
MEDAGKKVVFSMKEVGEHTVQDDCWMVIEGKVGDRFLGAMVLVFALVWAQNGFRIFICLFVLSRQVYDVTKFMDDHPGGDDVLLQSAGMI